MLHKYVAPCALALFALGSAPALAGSAPLSAYLKITDVAWESASPGARRIAYTARDSGNWQVWVANFDGSRRRQLTNDPDAIDAAWWVPNDAHTILYTKSHGGDGVDQFNYVRDDRPGSVALFPNEPKVGHVFGAFSPDGSKLAFSSNRRKTRDFERLCFESGNRERAPRLSGEGAAYATAWSPDAKALLVRHVLTPYNDDLYTVNLQTGAARLLTPHGGAANFDSSQFTPDMRSVICVSDLNGEVHAIRRINIATREMTPVLNLRRDVDQVALSPDGRRMAYIVNRDGFGDAVADAATGRKIGSPAMPPSIAEQLEFIDGGRMLLFDAEGPTYPKVPWAYDLRSGKTTRILQPNFRGVAPMSIVEPQVVHIRSFDGTMVPAWYFRPKTTRGNLVVELDIHGGPEEQDRAWLYPWAQYLTSRGYALLDPNIRGSSGYGRTYLHMADGRERENAVKDVKALRDWLADSGGAGPKSIFVNGASYGGYVVLSSLYHYPYAWAGGIDVYGVADWVDFLEKTGEDRANREAVYGSLAHDRQFLRSISPINHVNKIKRPVLIIAGANDPIVRFLQASGSIKPYGATAFQPSSTFSRARGMESRASTI